MLWSATQGFYRIALDYGKPGAGFIAFKFSTSQSGHVYHEYFVCTPSGLFFRDKVGACCGRDPAAGSRQCVRASSCTPYDAASLTLCSPPPWSWQVFSGVESMLSAWKMDPEYLKKKVHHQGQGGAAHSQPQPYSQQPVYGQPPPGHAPQQHQPYNGGAAGSWQQPGGMAPMGGRGGYGPPQHAYQQGGGYGGQAPQPSQYHPQQQGNPHQQQYGAAAQQQQQPGHQGYGGPAGYSQQQQQQQPSYWQPGR